jgi:two-component system OmpR family sensor kinase/two-component system sensor histidine kinase BaeS
MLLRLGIFWVTILALSAGSCTLLFWLIATYTGSLVLGANELYLIRATGLAAIVLGAVGFFIVVSALRRVAPPLREMMQAAERVADGDYTHAVAERGPREFRALARAFNQMAGEMRRHEEERRNLIANIARELRTPLSLLQENVEGLVDGNFARDDAHLHLILGETLRLNHLVDELRTLALAQSGGLILQREPTDIGALVRDTLAAFHRDASARDVALHAEIPDEPLYANIDPGRIQEVIGYLLLTAIRSGGRDQDVYVNVGAEMDETGTKPVAVEVMVKTQGWEVHNNTDIFDRFWRSSGAPVRSDNESPSSDSTESVESGLELAIAKQLVLAHGGEISASPTFTHNPGQALAHGTQITFTLPLDNTVS